MTTNSTENRYAICVGINQYQPDSGLNPLRYAEKDAQDFRDLLLQSGFTEANCKLLVGTQASLTAINAALKDVLINRAKRDDLVIFYFAGHGCRVSYEEEEVVSEVFLAPSDFERTAIQTERSFRLDEALGLRRLKADFFERTRSNKLLFILDSCHSGDFAGTGYRDDFDPQDSIRGVFAGSKAGRLALSSCSPTDRAFEDAGLEQGVFTHYLLEGLRGADEALEHDGWVTAGSLHSFICRRLEDRNQTLAVKKQKPNLYGNQQGRFELIAYPAKARSAAPFPPAPQKADRTERLRQRLDPDRDRLLDSRLASFAPGSRQSELEQVEELLAKGLASNYGSYLIITAQAGEGKTSLIAQLIARRPDRATIPYHFIPFSPGSDHQITLLHSLMASLALKHPELADYWTETNVVSSLAGTFSAMLRQLSELGRPEIIFIDGLDQIKPDAALKERDLAFLPTELPPGIVVVIGTRPDDTLLPLERKTHQEPYPLPHLSRADFGKVLEHKGVTLVPPQAQDLYTALQGNAFDLELAGQLLKEAHPETLASVIAQIRQHPTYLLDFRLDPLRNRDDWYSVIKRVLGCLLATVSTQPLTEWQLTKVTGLDGEQVSLTIARLGGMLGQSDRKGEPVYYLYHLKLIDYLLADNTKPGKKLFGAEGLREWHNTLAGWCEQGGSTQLWQDSPDPIEQGRRDYARQHYISHLYQAQEWERLFAVLDEGAYGRGKLKHDPSTRSYALDLALGRQAASRPEWGFEGGVAKLPNLWRYTLLQCSLNSQSNNLPVEWFKGMVLIGEEQEALGRVEMLTDLEKKAAVLTHIASCLTKMEGKATEGITLLLQAKEVALAMEDGDRQAKVLRDIASALAKAGEFQEARAVAQEISDSDRQAKAEVLRDIASALAKAGEFQEAIAVAQEISDNHSKTKAEAWRDIG